MYITHALGGAGLRGGTQLIFERAVAFLRLQHGLFQHRHLGLELPTSATLERINKCHVQADQRPWRTPRRAADIAHRPPSWRNGPKWACDVHHCLVTAFIAVLTLRFSSKCLRERALRQWSSVIGVWEFLLRPCILRRYAFNHTLSLSPTQRIQEPARYSPSTPNNIHKSLSCGVSGAELVITTLPSSHLKKSTPELLSRVIRPTTCS
jgi:hypothetical protein